MEIRDPQIVCVADLLILIHSGQTKRQTTCILRRFGFDLVHVERRVCHNVIARALKIVSIVIEAVCFVARHDFGIESVNCHIHNTELCIIVELFLTVEGHCRVCARTVLLDKIGRGNEHTARTASGIKNSAVSRLDDVDDHTNEGFRREENAVVGSHHGSKFVEEVFVNSSDDIILNLIERAIVEDSEKITEKTVLQNSVVLGENTFKLSGLLLDQLYRVVDGFAHICIIRKIQKIIIASFFGQENCTFCLKVICAYGQNSATTLGAILENLTFYEFESAVCIAKKDKPQYGHTILLRRYFGIHAEQVRRFP